MICAVNECIPVDCKSRYEPFEHSSCYLICGPEPLSRQVRAITITEEARREAQAECDRICSADSGWLTQGDREDVFIAQLHRRAMLVNDGFQLQVLAVLREHEIGAENVDATAFQDESADASKYLMPHETSETMLFLTKIPGSVAQQDSFSESKDFDAATDSSHPTTGGGASAILQFSDGHLKPTDCPTQSLEGRAAFSPAAAAPSLSWKTWSSVRALPLQMLSKSQRRTSSIGTACSDLTEGALGFENGTNVELCCTFTDGEGQIEVSEKIDPHNYKGRWSPRYVSTEICDSVDGFVMDPSVFLLFPRDAPEVS